MGVKCVGPDVDGPDITGGRSPSVSRGENRRKRQHYRVTVSLVQQPLRLCTESNFFACNDGASHVVSGNNPDR
jgi:hypothetical protein